MKIVSKLIVNSRLQAHIDRQSGLVVIDQDGTDIKQLQQLSLQYVGQINKMVKSNEITMEIMNHSQAKAMQAEKAAAYKQQEKPA